MGLRYRSSSSDSPREWFYRVEMDWHSFEDGTTRDPTKVYEETFTTAWNDNLQPTNYLSYVEKARPITVENSNMYNITQTLAETFGIFCRYEYDYDENYHIIGRNIIFYNSFNVENFGMLGITYPYNSSNISRTIDSSNLTTKLFVLDAKGTNDEDSYSIMNAAPNASKEDYILNFDYLYKTGAITQEQYDAIKPYEIQMRQYNEELITLHNNLAAYQMQLPEAQAQKTLYERAIDLDTEQLAQSTALQNTLDAKDGIVDGLIEITENNPDTKIVNNHIVDLKNTNKGIQANTLKIYSTYTSTAASGSKLTNQITSYICHFDEHGNLDALHNVTPSNNTNTVYMIYKYDPQLYYEAVANTWNIKLGQDTNQLAVYTDLVDELENNIEQITIRINELTNSENGLMVVARRQFEQLMGPALREGYWQPEEYNNYGDVYSIEKDFQNTGNIKADTGTGAITVWDETLFPEEDKAYYQEGVSGNNTNYVCINLQELFPDGIPTNIDEYSLVFNSNYIDPNDEPTAIYNLSYYAIGSQIQLGFIKRNKNIIPALIFIGSKNMTDAEIKHMKNSDKGRARLSIVGTTNGLVNGNESQSVSIEANAWLTSNSNFEVAYPRIKFSSLNLKTDTSNLIIWYDTHLLEQAKDYYINTRNNLRNDGNYYLEYFITIKPTVLFKYGQTQNLLINYVMSNACTAIYLDAKKVSVENAYPQVSYAVDINTINNSISQVLYNRLAQIVTINDTDLKLEDAYGYISEINLDLDNIQNDTIEIKNYKNKFEDMFSTILAQTEAMKYNGQSYNSAAVGQVGLTNSGFAQTLEDNKEALNQYFNEYYNNSPVVQEQLQQLFTEAGEILASSAEGQNKLAALTMANAHTLNGFVTNVANELTSTVYRSEFKPDSFKRGDIWIRLNRENGQTKIIGQYIAVANSSDVTGTGGVGSDTAGFARTYDGSLASITGAALNVDTVAGTIDIEAQNYINLRSGDVYIAANNNVEIVGGNEVNIGGTRINLCSLYSKNFDPITGELSSTNELHETTGINLIAGAYEFENGQYIGNNAHVFINPTQIEMGASELLLKAASKINLLVSQGEDANTSAILLDADRGIDISSGAGLRLYSGTAAPEIYVGPTHATAFHKGDYWIQTNSISNHYDYSEENSQYYADIITNTTLYPNENNMNGVQILKIWQASQNVDESLQNSTTNWNQVPGARLTAINLIQSQGASGATIELNKEHLILGYNEVTYQNSSGSIIEFTKNDIVLGVGTTDRTLNVTGISGGLIGAKFTKDSIGFAVTTNSITNAILMNSIGITLGSGVNVTETIGNLNTAVATAIANGTVGSYVRITPSGVYIGSSGELYINTTNFLINSKATGANSLFELRSATDWYLKYSLQNGLQIKGQVTAIGSNGQFIADGNHFGLYNTSGNPILTLSGTQLQVSNGYTFSAAGAITINSDNLIVNPNATGNNTLFKAMNGSNGIIVEGDGDTTVTGTINATGGTFSGDITATGTISGATINGGTINGGSINITSSGTNSGTLNIGSGNNSLSYNSSGDLVVHGDIYANNGTFTGTINARELHVGAQGADCMTYGNGALTIGNYSGGKGIYYDGNDFNIQGGIVATTLTIGTNGTFMNYDATNGLSIGNGGLTYNGNSLSVTGIIHAQQLYITNDGTESSASDWINMQVTSETIWAGVKTATGGRNLVLDDAGIRLNSGNTTNMELTNGGITMTAGVINLEGTSYLKLASGNSLITLDSSGIAISGANFSVATTPLTINSSPSSGGYVINSNDHFMVDADGNVYLKSVKVLQENGTYTTIDLSQNFNQAVSISGEWSGTTYTATASFWGKFKQQTATSVSLYGVDVTNLSRTGGVRWRGNAKVAVTSETGATILDDTIVGYVDVTPAYDAGRSDYYSELGLIAGNYVYYDGTVYNDAIYDSEGKLIANQAYINFSSKQVPIP